MGTRLLLINVCVFGILLAIAQPAQAEGQAEAEPLAEANLEETSGSTEAESSPMQPVSDLPRLNELPQPATTIESWMNQIAQAAPVQITGVQVNMTEAGLSLVLETAGEPLQPPTTNVIGNALIADIANAELVLPSGEPEFQSANPAEGVALVSVTTLPNNRVRIAITGTESPPTAEAITTATGLAFNVTTGVATAATPGDEAIQVVVTATRTEEDVTEVPRSVTVITREEIEQQATLTRNLSDILGQLVPGLGTPTQSTSTITQTLRGREPAILIDGVPQLTNRRFFTDLRTIDPSAIERIEVVRGPSAVYGGGATGGVINIITRSASQEPFTATTEVGIDTALNEAFLTGDSIGYFIQQGFSGTLDRFDYNLILSRTDVGLFYDASGDRIPVENTVDISDSLSYNILGKVGFDFDEQQRFQATFNYFDDRIGTEFLSDPIVDTIPGVQTSRALQIEGREFEDARPPGSRNTVATLTYSHDNLLGSQVNAQAYYRDYTSLSIPFDRRDNEILNAIVRGRLEEEEWGGRLGIDTPLIQDRLSLLWGADYANERTLQFFETFDPEEFDETDGRIYRRIGRLDEVPRYTIENLGLFAQLQWDISDRLLLTGGARHEDIDFSVDDYTTLEGIDIEGGNLNFNDTVFNLGTSYQLTDNISVFANFAQSFSIPDLGRIIRDPSNLPTQAIASDLRISSPQKVDNYEIGVRGNWDAVQFSLAGFYNYSDLGATVRPRDDDPLLIEIVRAPQRNYGLEATIDVQPSDTWFLGTAISWSEGENDEDENGEFLALSNRFIAPIKVTAYVENQTFPGWRNRLQMLLSGSRDRSFDAGVDDGTIDSYLIVDYISSIDVGPGTLNIGIQNLFNTQYSPAFFQWAAGESGEFDSFGAAGRGRSVSLSYSFTW
jgi:iron complex outermembrane receptor protein